MSDTTHADWPIVATGSADLTPPTNGKPTRPDRRGLPNTEAEAAKLAAAVVEAEEELTHDQKALKDAEAEVDRLKAWVAFDQKRIESRTKSRDTFDRLQAKAGK